MRYARSRLAGLEEAGNRGAPPKYGPAEQKRILAMLDRPPPDGYANWTPPLLARARSDLSGRKSWCESSDPEFMAEAAEIVGPYVAPADNAIVLSIDEKPSIQALERAHGYLKLPNGRAMTGRSHDYKRNGTTTLFAAFEVATGVVTDRHYKRRRRVEFLDFMNKVVADYLDWEIHVILDNLLTHNPNCDLWLARHKNVHFHYTPTRASWLNQVEVWFSILSGKSLDDPSTPSKNSRRMSTASSPATTTTPDRSRGQKAKSNTSAQGPVSPINDSRY